MGKIIAIIPARGESKGIPKKNIVNFCGKPLIAYSILIAKKTKSIDRVIVDTDSQEIANVAKKYGAEILYLRPKNLAQDLTPDLPVFQHAIRFLIKHGENPKAIVHLRPTAPYRTVEYLEKAIKLFCMDKKTTCVRSVVIPNQNPYKMWRIGRKGFLKPLLMTRFKEPYNFPRQKLPKTYWHVGNIDVIKTEVILNENSMTGKFVKPLILDEIFSIDIESQFSLKVAEVILKSYLKKI